MMGAQQAPYASDVEQTQLKDTAAHSEYQNRGGMSPEDVEFLENFPEERKKKSVRKVDVSLPGSIPLASHSAP